MLVVQRHPRGRDLPLAVEDLPGPGVGQSLLGAAQQFRQAPGVDGLGIRMRHRTVRYVQLAHVELPVESCQVEPPDSLRRKLTSDKNRPSRRLGPEASDAVAEARGGAGFGCIDQIGDGLYAIARKPPCRAGTVRTAPSDRGCDDHSQGYPNHPSTAVSISFAIHIAPHRRDLFEDDPAELAGGVFSADKIEDTAENAE